MSNFTSTPTDIVIQLPVYPSTQFGAGTDVGTVVGDVWTPGRDSAGLINAVSWAIVPRGRWTRIAGTRLDALDAAVKAVYPSFQDYGGTTGAPNPGPWDGVSCSWSGFAPDTTGSRVWLLGGGHSNSSNNGLYRFDCYRMAWYVECLPTDPQICDPGYLKSYSFTAYGPSADLANARQAANTLSPINDIFYDELPDGKPTARHTYSSIVYAPDKNRLVMICRRLWKFNITTGMWDYKRLLGDSYASVLDGEHGITVYDEKTGDIISGAAGSSGVPGTVQYSLASDSWKPAPPFPFSTEGCRADVRVGRQLVVVSPPTNPSSQYGGAGGYQVLDLDSRTVSSGTFQFAAGASRSLFGVSNGGYQNDSPSLVYIETTKRYWLWAYASDGSMQPFEIDPSTTPWTLVGQITFSGSAPVVSKDALVVRKIVYMPALGAVIFHDFASNDMLIYRV